MPGFSPMLCGGHVGLGLLNMKLLGTVGGGWGKKWEEAWKAVN